MGKRERNEEKRKVGDTRRTDRQNKVREGQENSSIHGDPGPPGRHEYPHPRLADKQYERQPEFTEPESSRTDEVLEQERLARKNGSANDGD